MIYHSEKRDIEIEFVAIKAKHGDKYRLVKIGKQYEIQHYSQVGKTWCWDIFIDEEPCVGFGAIFGLGYKVYDDQELYAKKFFIDYVKDSVKKEEITVL